MNETEILELLSQMSAAQGQLSGVQAEHAETLLRLSNVAGRAEGKVASLANQVRDLKGQVAAVAERLPGPAAGGPNQPGPPPRPWDMPEFLRLILIRQIRTWLGEEFLPGYGHLAQPLPACWDQHPVAITALWLAMEQHKLLYVPIENPGAHVGALIGWYTGTAGALMRIVHHEAANCDHVLPQPEPLRLWQLGEDTPARDTAVAGLQAWVDKILVRIYEQRIPRCWPLHPLAIEQLDALRARWLLIHREPARDGSQTAAQLDWLIRLMPEVTRAIKARVSECSSRPGHDTGLTDPDPLAGAVRYG